MRKTECSFCRLVAHTGCQILQSTTEILSSHENDAHCELCGDSVWNRYVTRVRVFCLKITIASPNEHEQIIRRGNIQQILTSGDHPPEQSLNDSRLVKDQIDMELIQCWLEICYEQHKINILEEQHCRWINGTRHAHGYQWSVYPHNLALSVYCDEYSSS